MKNFSIREAIGRGWELWKGNTKLLILATLILGVLNVVSGTEGKGIMFDIARIVLTLIYVFVYIGWMRILIKVYDGVPTTLNELTRSAHVYWRYLGTTIIFGLIVGIGTILLVIPGIYLFLKYQFAPLLILDKNLSIREAFEESGRITDGAKWKLLGFILVLLGLQMLGAIAFMIGLLISMPVGMLAVIHVYRKLSGVGEVVVVPEPAQV